MSSYHDFTMSSLAPAVGTAHPTRCVFTGERSITLQRGVMRADDTGWLDCIPLGPYDFETIVNVDCDGGPSEGANGPLVATGALDLSTREGEGAFEGEVCRV